MAKEWLESDFVGGCVCLDFVNTIDNRVEPAKYKDWLLSYADLVSWECFAGVITHDVANRLNKQLTTDPKIVNSVFDQALRLRDAIYRTFNAISVSSTPNNEDIMKICSAFADIGRYLSLAPIDGGVAMHLRIDPDDPSCLIVPIAYSANELLLSGRLASLKCCKGCGWLFLDTSKNGRRRWCDMKTCGNRAKIRRHRNKLRE